MVSDGRARFRRGAAVFLLASFVFWGSYISASRAADAPESPQSSESGNPAFMDSLSSMVSTVIPMVAQLLSSSPEGSEGASGGLGALYDIGQKASGALSTSLASDETREALWVPLHEQLGQMRDFLGLQADDAQGVRNAARLLADSQLPLIRFAAEREVCNDPEADQKALKLVTEHPAAQKMLLSYMKQEPDRKLRGAPADLAAMYSEIEEYLSALRGAGESQVLPVSILAGLDALSKDAATKIRAYLATVARYFMYGDRFAKNKKALVFFTRHVLPRILQLFALQLDGCRYLWRYLAELSPRPGIDSYESATEAPVAQATGVFNDGPGALGSIAQNLGFKTPSSPHATARAFGRRLLARVQVQIGALYSLSRGCLAATSLTFQRQYAEAQDRVELGESPTTAFSTLLEQSEQIRASKNGQEILSEAAQEEKEKRVNPRVAALARLGRGGSNEKTETETKRETGAEKITEGEASSDMTAAPAEKQSAPETATPAKGQTAQVVKTKTPAGPAEAQKEVKESKGHPNSNGVTKGGQ